jgi:hypothetical protein
MTHNGSKHFDKTCISFQDTFNEKIRRGFGLARDEFLMENGYRMEHEVRV